MKASLITLMAALTVSANSFAGGMPQSITFVFGGTTAVGRRQGFEPNAFRPQYKLEFKNNGKNTTGDLKLDWNWPGDLSFTFLHHGNGKTCNGTAKLSGSVYVGTLSCASGSYSVTIQ